MVGTAFVGWYDTLRSWSAMAVSRIAGTLRTDNCGKKSNTETSAPREAAHGLIARDSCSGKMLLWKDLESRSVGASLLLGRTATAVVAR